MAQHINNTQCNMAWERDASPRLRSPGGGVTHCVGVREGADDWDVLSACGKVRSVLGAHTPVRFNHRAPGATFCLEMQLSPNGGISASLLQHWRTRCPLWESRRTSACWAQSQEGRNVWDRGGPPTPAKGPPVLSKAVKARTVLAVISLHSDVAFPTRPFYLRC